jgi:hypothetical protein
MTLNSQYVEAQQPDLQSRVQQAMLGAAQNIAAADPSEPNHAARSQLATQVSRSPTMFTDPFTALVCSQGITRDSTDTDIETMVSACWNTMAGQSAVV